MDLCQRHSLLHSFCLEVRNIIPALQQNFFAGFLLEQAEDLLIGHAGVGILNTESRRRWLDDVDVT